VIVGLAASFLWLNFIMVKKYNDDDLFSTYPGTKVDLEWMMQNEQIQDEMLARALVEEFYEEALLFAAYRLNDPDKARRLVGDAIIKAVSNRHHYWGDSSLKAWIVQMVSDSIRKYEGNGGELTQVKIINEKRFNRLDPDLIEIAILHFGIGLSVQEIAFVKRKDKQDILFQISRLYHQLTDEPTSHIPGAMRHDSFMEAVNRSVSGEIDDDDRQQLETHLESCHLCRDYAAKVEKLRRELESDFNTYSSMPRFNNEDLRQAAEEIGERASQKINRRRVSVTSKEALLVGLIIALFAIVGWAVSILGEEDEFGVSSQAPVTENGDLAFAEDTLQEAGEGSAEDLVIPNTGEIEPYEGYTYHRLSPIETGVDLLRLYLEGFLNDDHWNEYSGALVLESVFHYWSVDRNINDVIRFRSRSRMSHLSPVTIVNYVEEETFLAADNREGGSIEILRELTDAGFPVIVLTGGTIQQNQYDIVTGFWTYCECIVLGSSFVREETGEIEVSSFLDDWEESDYTYILIYPSWKTEGVKEILGEEITHAPDQVNQCSRGTHWQ